ncbi:MAG: hypothetical protein SFY81_16655 [Verrucomicrobiota bacterium]|nr:hypothetical protein [Verrucomicrobiota bacterium]
MTKSNIFLVTLAVLLAAVYSYYFTDWFKKPTIQIIAASVPVGPLVQGGETQPVQFTFDKKYALTSIKVISSIALHTNKLATPAWHLTTQSNSVPLRGFRYGFPIPGMTNSSIKRGCDQLQPLTPYTIIVEAGKARGQAEFLPQPIRKSG